MDWADEMAQKIKQQMEGAEANDSKEAQLEKRIQHDGPAVWEALKGDINAQGQRLNSKLGKELVTRDPSQPDEMILLADFGRGPRRLAVGFYPTTGTVTWIKNTGGTGSYRLQVTSLGPLAFFGSGGQVGTGDIARRLLEELLR